LLHLPHQLRAAARPRFDTWNRHYPSRRLYQGRGPLHPELATTEHRLVRLIRW
jgi:hypothetical protein